MNNEESAMLDFIGLNNPIESSSDSEDQTTQQTPPPENTQSRMFDELGLSSNPEPEAPVAEEITPTEDPTERSLSDVGSDILVGLGKGSNQLLDIAGSLYGLKTGNFDNAASRIAQENLAYYEQRKSEGLLAREDQLALDIKNEEGLIGKGMAAFVGTVSDPALLGNFITEQLPMLAATAGTGALAGAGAKIAGAGAKGIATSATAGAIGGGAVMQGASVGGEVHREYEDFLAENPGYIPVQDEYVELLNDGMTEDEARAEIGLHLARTSALEAGAISLIVQRLPGAATLDKALAGVKLNPGVATSLASRIGYAAKGAVGEGVSEAIEEGSGAFIGNTAESTYNEDVDLLEGVGEAAGYGAASFVFGGAGGLSQGRATDESAANSNEESTTPHQDALEEHGGPAEGLDELALLAEQEAAQQKLPSDDVATDISEDDRANLDSSEYINELNSFVNDDSNYNDVFDEVDEIVGLEDFTPTVDDIDGLSESDLAPEDPSFSEDDSAQEQQLSEEQRQAEYENSHAQTTTRSEEQDVDFGNFDESVPSVEVNGTQRRVSVTSQEDSVPPEGSEEKRTDLSRRERIAALTPEEVEAALYKNELTGIENRRSFEEQVGNAEHVVSIDADSLKAINDSMGADSGDALLRANAEALQEVFGDQAFHISGDEFYVLGNDVSLLEEGMQKVAEKLAEAEISSDRSDGSKITAKGLRSTYAISSDKSSADEQLKKNKVDLESQGQRSPRGVIPNGVTRVNSDGTITDMSGEAITEQTESGIQSDTQNVANSASTPNEEVATNVEEIRSTNQESGQNEESKLNEQAGDAREVRPGNDQDGRLSETATRLPEDGQRDESQSVGPERDSPSSIPERTKRVESEGRKRKLSQQREQNVRLRKVADKHLTRKSFESELQGSLSPEAFQRLKLSGNLATAYRQSQAERAKSRVNAKARKEIKNFVVKQNVKSKGRVIHLENLSDNEVVGAFVEKISSETGHPVGAVYNEGQIFVIADNVVSTEHARQLVAHEAFHAALDDKVEGVNLRKSLDSLVREVGGTKGIRKLAERNNIDITPYEQYYDGDAMRDHIVMEELLAMMAEGKRSKVRDLAMNIQKNMRKLAHLFGFMPASNKNIDSKIQSLISEANKVYRQSQISSGAVEPKASIGKTEGAYEGKRGTHMKNMPKTVKMNGKDVEFTGFKTAQDAAKTYAARAGIDYSPVQSYAKVDESRAELIADAYDRMKHDPKDPEVKAAYQAMIDETLAQYEVMLETGLKVEFNPTPGVDPYGNPRNATLDVVNNNRLYVFPTNDGFGSSDLDVSDNPMLAESPFMFGDQVALVNDIFRAVHDYFGHIKDGNGFRARGEEHAWRSHSSMYSPEARRAMTSETRGQNSWVNYGPNANDNSTASGADTIYAEQKTGLMPEWVSNEGRSDPKASLSSKDFIAGSNKSFSIVNLFSTMMGVRRADNRRAMRKVAKRYFSTTNNLSESAFELKLLADNERSIDERQIAVLNKAFEKGLKKVGKGKKEKVLKDFNSFLSNKDADVNMLPPSMRNVATSMRSYLDNYSTEIAGIVQSDIDNQVNLMSDEAYEQFLTYQETNGEQGVVSERLIKAIELHDTIIGNIGQYLNRSFQAFDDSGWKRKVLENDDLMNRAREYFAEQDVNEEGESNLTEDEVEGAIVALLDSARDTGDITGLITRGSTYGRKEINILKPKNNDMPSIVLELLGEYGDPKVNFTKSASKMSNFIVNHNFLNNFREEGINTGFLHARPKSIDGENYTVLIASKTSQAMNPLNGLYTTDEVRQAMQDFVEPTNFGPVMRAMMASAGTIKYGKTVLDVSVHVFNFLANISFLTANGHLDPREFVGATKTIFADISTSDSSMIEKLLRLGVIHDNPRSGELNDTVDEIVSDDSKLENRFTKPIFDIAKGGLNALNVAYQAEDDFFKVVAFNSQLKKNLRAGMSENEAESHAAHRVRNGYPTYSMVPRAVIKVRQVPFIGAFPSFPWEVMRTGVNQFRFLAEDWQNDKRSAYVRLAGLIAISSGIQTVSALSMLHHGIDEEEDEALKQVGPSWSKNSTFIYKGFDEHGNPRYIDVSRYDSFDYPKRIIRAGINFRDRGLVDMDDSAFWELVSPFVGADILAGAAYEAASNDRIGSTRPVRNTKDTGYEQVKSTVENFLKSTAPGSAIKLYNIYDAQSGGATFFGKKKVVADELKNFFGYRVNTADLSVSYGFKVSSFRHEKGLAESILRTVVNDQNTFSPDEIKNAFNRMIYARENTYKDMLKITEGVRGLGLSESVIEARLEALSKADTRAILDGEIPDWKMSSRYGKGLLESAKIGAPDQETRDELDANFNAKISLINELLEAYKLQRKSSE